jgi:hypothetical protein
MLQGHDEFVLLDEQKTAYETILRNSRDVQTGGKKVLIVKGGPGTGKSVISINALATLTSERLNVRYVTANAAPRDVFQAKLKGLLKGDSVKHLFSGSGSYTESKKNSMDVLIVDEAHRLRMKSGMFRNMGESQAKEIIHTAKLSVFFIDEAQKVTWSDVGEISRIKAYAAEQGMDLTELLDARLIEDMASLTKQVQMTTDTAKFVAVRVGQVENQPWTDDEASYDDVQARVTKAISFLEAASPEGFEAREDAKVVLTTPSGDIPFTGSVYVHGFAIPNFFFHLSMAYALLRMKGVPVGKLDFLGAIR